jgi:hypothetical protein
VAQIVPMAQAAVSYLARGTVRRRVVSYFGIGDIARTILLGVVGHVAARIGSVACVVTWGVARYIALRDVSNIERRMIRIGRSRRIAVERGFLRCIVENSVDARVRIRASIHPRVIRVRAIASRAVRACIGGSTRIGGTCRRSVPSRTAGTASVGLVAATARWFRLRIEIAARVRTRR